MSNHPQCRFCEGDIYVDATLTNAALGRMYGVSKDSIRRHRKHMDEVPVAPDSFFGIPNEIITSRGKTVRLPDGSYEKISYAPAKLAWVHALEFDDLADVFDKPVDNYPTYSTNRKPRTLVVCAADFQVGKVDELGGTRELIDRVKKVYAQIWEYAAASQFDEIIFADVGDAVEGFGNTVSQDQTNDLSLTDQIRAVKKLLGSGVKMFSRVTPKLTYVAVSSNHCSVRSGKGNKTRSNAPDDDWGLLVQEQIEDSLEGRPGYENVHFVKPSKWEEAVTFRTAEGTVLGFTHGHLMGNQNRAGEWFKDMRGGRRSGLHMADILVHGHFHNASLQTSADDAVTIGAPTMDNGSSWYTNTSGNSSKPGMLTFEVNNGDIENWKIWRP